jgi:predicted secreted protein
LSVLDGQIRSACWSLDGTTLAFALGPPFYEIWAAEIDPNVSTVEALGPAQTLDEHILEMVAFYSRRIGTDPQDACAHSSRARYYDCLHEREKAITDMRQWSAILSGSDLHGGTSRKNKRILNGPFNCQFVFSAERLVNETPILNVAFGQKGRCNMKSFKIPILSMSLLGLCLLSGLDTPPAHADFTFGTPTNVGTPLNTAADDGTYSFSTDGLELYCASNLGRASDDYDLYVSTRSSIADVWSEPVNLGPIINSSYYDSMPCLSSDGLELFFNSERPGGSGTVDLWVTTRTTKADTWTHPVNLGPVVNSKQDEQHPTISSDGLTLIFESWQSGGYGGGDLWVSTRDSTSNAWNAPMNLGPTVNTPYNEFWPRLSPDDQVLFFSSDNRPGGFGGIDLWMAIRGTIDDSWSVPVNLGSSINTSAYEGAPTVSLDGSILYFASDRPGGLGGWDQWQVPIIPTCDFNGDGIVDAADVCIMVEHWLTDEPLCDIGPMPWGDGIVDVQDLIVLAEHLFEIYPSAETVDVNEANNGGQIELELGKLLVVSLESNPSTGYRWELVENNESILKHFGQTEFKPSETSDPPIVGASGWEIFRFKAVSAGQMTLELVYHRSWEDAEPLNTFLIQVTVN